MTSHWPTFADGLFWCACDNRTFDEEWQWQNHVVVEGVRELVAMRVRLAALPDDFQPSESSVRHDAPSR